MHVNINNESVGGAYYSIAASPTIGVDACNVRKACLEFLLRLSTRYDQRGFLTRLNEKAAWILACG